MSAKVGDLYTNNNNIKEILFILQTDVTLNSLSYFTPKGALVYRVGNPDDEYKISYSLLYSNYTKVKVKW